MPPLSAATTHPRSRRVGTQDYRGKVRILPTGVVRVGIARTASTGVQTLLSGETVVAGLTYAAGDSLVVRVQATGTAPTLLKVKVWKLGSPEPAAWQLSTTDTTATLQTPGAVGVHAYLSSSVTNAPIKVSYDNFRVGGFNRVRLQPSNAGATVIGQGRPRLEGGQSAVWILMPRSGPSATLVPMSETAGDLVGTGRLSRSGRRWRGWRPSTWLLLASAVVVEFVVTFAACGYIFLLTSGVCREPATAEGLLRAQRYLMVVAIVASLPWLLVLRAPRYKLRLACFAAAAIAFSVFWMIKALVSSPQEWTLTWCLF